MSVLFLGMYDIYFLLARGGERSSIVMFRVGTVPNYHAFLRILVLMMIIIDLCYTCHNGNGFFMFCVVNKIKHLSKKNP